jgi:flagellar basal-body rod modification protein FlgD
MSVSSTEGVGTPYFGTPAAASATGTNSASSASDSLSAATSVDKDMFLKLMVAQLKNQDPLNPTDSSQFLAQTAQFTSLEKLTTVADQTQQALSAQLAFGASGLVGKTVGYTDPNGASATGAVSSVRFTSSGPMLQISGTDVPLSSINSVTTAGTDAGGTGTDA